MLLSICDEKMTHVTHLGGPLWRDCKSQAVTCACKSQAVTCAYSQYVAAFLLNHSGEFLDFDSTFLCQAKASLSTIPGTSM